MRRFFYILITALFIVSCSEKDKQDFSSDFIGFSPLTDDVKSVSINSDTDLQNSTNGGFGVFAYYTGTNNFVSPSSSSTIGTMMQNQQVTYTDANTGWTYSPAQYWPMNGGKVSFYAYAPYNTWKNLVTTTGVPTIAYTAGTNLTNQNDLLWGVGDNGYPIKDMTKPADKTAHLHFKHAVCRLKFKIATDEDFSAINNYFYNYGYGQVTTRVFIESFMISGFYKTGTLSLENTSESPAWSNKSGALAYPNSTFTSSIPESIKYYSNNTTMLNNWSTYGDSYGVGSSLTDLIGDNFIYAIPKTTTEGKLTLTIKYHIITRYYYPFGSNQGFKINRSNDSYYGGGSGTTVTATNTIDIKGNSDETFNLILKGNYMTLQVQAKPWEYERDTLSFDSGQTVINQGNQIHWQSGSYDSKSNENVYINAKTGICQFKISSPTRYLWSATLVPKSGNASAFMFVDESGNEIENPNGVIGKTGVLRIKARKSTSNIQNSAILRVFIKKETESEIVKELGFNGTTEYVVIQDAS